MTKWKDVFRNLCTFIENEIQKSLIYVTIHTPNQYFVEAPLAVTTPSDFWVNL